MTVLAAAVVPDLAPAAPVLGGALLAAAALLLGPRGFLGLLGTGAPAVRAPQAPDRRSIRAGGRQGRVPRPLVAVAVVVGGVVLAAGGGVRGPVVAHLVLGSLAALGVVQLRRRSVARAELERATLGAGRACELLVGEVGAGVPPPVALRRVAEHHPTMGGVVAAAGVGSDVPTAFRRLAREAQVSTWGRVADAWQVSQESGAALAPVLARVAQAERDETARRRLVRTELADAVATARLMAVLPWVLVGVASLGGGTGAEFLLTTWPGFVCAALGAGLVAAGLAWIERISSEGPP